MDFFLRVGEEGLLGKGVYMKYFAKLSTYAIDFNVS